MLVLLSQATKCRLRSMTSYLELSNNRPASFGTEWSEDAVIVAVLALFVLLTVLSRK